MVSSATGAEKQSDGHRVPPTAPPSTWSAHLALVLAGAGVAIVVVQRGGRSAFSVFGIILAALLVILFGAQAVIAIWAGRSLKAKIAHSLFVAGAVAMLSSRLVVGFVSVVVPAGIAIALFATGAVLLVMDLRSRRA